MGLRAALAVIGVSIGLAACSSMQVGGGSSPVTGSAGTESAVAGAAPQAVFGQVGGHVTDFRGNPDYTAEELRQALDSAAEPAVTYRGIGRAPTSQVPPVHGATAVINVFFASNSDRILPAYYVDLAKLGQALTPILASGANVRIEGHTDSLGPDQYNQRLSQKRAESVKRYLVQQFALPPERVLAEGYGKSRPVAPNDTPEGRGQNRRVQVVNLGTK
jgi:outer membrane protein OmpA-like peptidoglycan-associated protein